LHTWDVVERNDEQAVEQEVEGQQDPDADPHPVDVRLDAPLLEHGQAERGPPPGAVGVVGDVPAVRLELVDRERGLGVRHRTAMRVKVWVKAQVKRESWALFSVEVSRVKRFECSQWCALTRSRRARFGRRSSGCKAG
jgi:hypothetical protein